MRKMKDSGVEWIGEIPEDWKIGVRKVGSGKTPHGGAETYPDEGILFLRSQNVYDTGINMDSPTYISEETDEEMKNTRVYPNDVLLNITGGSIGRCCIFPQEFKQANVNQHVSIIRVNEDVFTSEYMHYFWICSLGKNAIELYQTGGNREGMSADAIKNTYIPYFPVEKQKEITNYLDKICNDINKNIAKTNDSIVAYKSFKQSLITRAVTKGVRDRREMKDSGSQWFGVIPEKWQMMRMKYLFHIQKDIAGEEGYTVLSITQRGIKVKDLSKNEGQMAADYSNYQLVHKGDFAMNHMDLLTGWVDISEFDGVTSPDYRVFVLDDKSQNYDKYYLYMMQMCYTNRIFYDVGVKSPYS